MADKPTDRTAEKWVERCTTWTKKPDVDKWELGEMMRNYRHKRGKSMRSVATAIGVSQPYLSDCERGFRKLDLNKLQKFIEACG